MLKPVAEGVQVHVSEFLLSNTIVVEGGAGVLLVDPGVQRDEMECLAREIPPVVAGFSTHPDWDHLLWIPELGPAPRYGTARCAAAAAAQLAEPDIKARIREHLEETGIADQVPLDLLGEITGLPDGTARVPWDGPEVRILEHRAHAPGHAALSVKKVLVAGDMLSDVLVPMLDLDQEDPIEDYLAALNLLETVADTADVIIPGHGTVGGPGQAKVRIERDRAYVTALREGRTPDDPRIGPDAEPGWEWVSDVHAGQVQRLRK